MDSLQSLFTKTKHGDRFETFAGPYCWAAFFGDFGDSYCCHMLVSGIVTSNFSYQTIVF